MISTQRTIGLVLAALIAGTSLVAAQTPAKRPPANAHLISFEVALVPPAAPDPFAPENNVKHVSKSPIEVGRGQLVQLRITGKLKAGYHTYPITQRSSDPEQSLSQLSKLRIEATPGIKPLWPISEPKPEWVVDKKRFVLLELKEAFTWSQDLLILPDAEPGTRTLRGSLKVVVCDDIECVQGLHPFEVPFTITAAPPIPLSEPLRKRMDAPEPAIQVLQAPADLMAQVGQASTEPPPAEGAQEAPAIGIEAPSKSLVGLLAASSLAAIGMLLTPCVFPMIPITVTFFLKQAEKKHHNALLTASVYALTIVIVLAAAVLVLGKLIIDWANSPWMNLGLGLLLMFFAFSLFGMYEIELPHFLTRFTSSREGQGGYLGAFFMALTFTITSFTCTGPFLGPLLVAVKETQASLGELVLAALAYSATFAAPFFVLALFPRLLKAMPKSGGWLNSVKVVMGFLEVAAALKFLANVDLAMNPGNPWFFNYETVLCAWIALSVACGLYLMGVYRLPHDSEVHSIGVVRLVLATIFFGLGIYMMPALWRETPMGVIGRGLVAFLPPDTRPRPVGGEAGGAQAHLSWTFDYEKAWADAKREGKLIFIDFTGVNCTNCRANETGVFPRPEVRSELARYVRVQLYTDTVPNPSLSAAEADQQADRNRSWQEETFGNLTNPLYVVLKPDGDAPVKDGKLTGKVLGRYAGYINDPQQFVKFLQAPLQTKTVANLSLDP